MKRPLLVAALAWTLGVVLSSRFELGAALPALSVPFLLLGLDFFRGSRDKRGGWIPTLLFMGLVLLGFLRAHLERDDLDRRIASVRPLESYEQRLLKGRLSSTFERTGENRRVRVLDAEISHEGTWIAIPGPVRLWLAGEETGEARAGDLVQARGSFRTADPGNPRFAASFQHRGLVGTFFCSDKKNLRVASVATPGTRDRLVRARDRWRESCRRLLLERLSLERAALVLAMTLGDRSAIGEDFRDRLLRSGLYHITAISGLHVTALLVAFPWALKLCGIPRRKRALVGIPLAILLLCLTGGRVPILRATIVGVSLMLGTFLDRRSHSLNLLGGAALAILLISPFEIWNPGFQLSFCIVASLCIWGWTPTGDASAGRLARFLLRFISPYGLTFPALLGVWRWGIAGMCSSLVATLAAAPITAWHFNQVHWGGIIGNLLGVPLAAVTTVLGMTTILCGALFERLAFLPGTALEFVSGTLLRWIDGIASIQPGLHLVSPLSLTTTALLAASALVLNLPREWKFGRRVNARVGILVAIALFSWVPSTGSVGLFKIAFLDVGQGDACLLRFPGGGTILVDTGPPTKNRRGQPSDLARSLAKLGVLRLDAVVITHPELDHFGGLSGLIESIPMGAVYCTGDTNASQEFRETARLVEVSTIPLKKILAGDRIDGFENATLKILAPSAFDLVHGVSNLNERSIVLLVECEGLRVLFTGDIGVERERELLENHPDLRADLLKVGHHGSGFSSSETFLRRVRPSVAVISCGKNSFGHPHPGALERLQRSGARVFVTAEHGTVRLRWSGRDLDVQTDRERE